MKKAICVLCVWILCSFVGCQAATNEIVLSGSLNEETVKAFFSEDSVCCGLDWNMDIASVEKALKTELRNPIASSDEAITNYDCEATLFGYVGELTLSFHDQHGLVRFAFLIPAEEDAFDSVLEAMKEAYGSSFEEASDQDQIFWYAWNYKPVKVLLKDSEQGAVSVLVRNEKYFSLK